MKLSEQDILEHIALAVYQRRRRNDMLDYGDAERDMNKAKDIVKFFEDNEAIRDSRWESKLEEYAHYENLYRFLKEQAV